MRLKYQIGVFLGILVILSLLCEDTLSAFFMTTSATINFISVFGTVITIISFIYALYERDSRKQVEDNRRAQLWISIDRARYTILDHNLIKELQKELKHENKHRIWLAHQAACDLYISLIEQYLSTIDKFTYKDLEYLCDNQVVYWKWQEKQWRILMCQRPENKNVEPPDYFVKSELSPYLQEKENT